MARNLVDLLLILTGSFVFLYWLVRQILDLIALPTSEFFTIKRFKYPILLLLLIGTPILFVNQRFINFDFSGDLELISDSTFTIYCWIVALAISLVWLNYILKLDIFEKEKWKHIISVFVMSFITSFGCEILYPLFSFLGFDLNGNIINDFIYCIFGIGLIEEVVKIIPFLILLKYTKAINEPYDYLLYASISALGFAFAENILYLNNYGIHIAAGRAFYAAVAHMTFCSTAIYGLLLKKYRLSKYPRVLVFLFFFFIAMFIHGFYDFWLINKKVSNFSGITTLFFLITIHLWFTMKNNAINKSPFYKDHITLDNDKLKKYLVISLISIFMFSYLYVAFFFGKTVANSFFWTNGLTYGYVVFYLIISFSNYNIVRGKLSKLNIPFTFIVPSLKKRK